MHNAPRGRRPRLLRALLAASLVACSAKTVTPGALVLGIHTNDLVIADDVNLIGLYVAQIEAGGRVRQRLAYEAAPLRVGDDVRIRFPASLVLEARDEPGDRIHARLIAYRGDRREVLTMREARSQVPSEGARLLKLNLFFTNAGNVVDSQPNTPMLETELSVQDQDGVISEGAFSRFQSVCEGRAAGVDQTADDSGRCVPLDIELGPHNSYDFDAGLRGGRKEDPCYDVSAAFQARADNAVRRIDTRALAPSGVCVVQLPGAYDPERLNLAMITAERAFETPDYGGAFLRPLAAGVAFTQSGTTVTLTAPACDQLRRAEVTGLIASQRTTAWRGGDPVCAPWSHAATPGSFEGPPPGPVPEGGTTPSDVELRELELPDLAVSRAETLSLVADGPLGVIGYATGASDLAVSTFRYDAPAVGAPATHAFGGEGHVRMVRFDPEFHFYVHDRSAQQVVRVVTNGSGAAAGFEPVTVGSPEAGMAEPGRGILALGVERNYLRSGLTFYLMRSPNEGMPTTTEALFLPGSVEQSAPWPAVAYSQGRGTGLQINTDGRCFFIDAQDGGTSLQDPLSGSFVPGDQLVGAGTAFYGTAQIDAGAPQTMFRYTAAATAETVLPAITGVERLAATADHLCYTWRTGDARALACVDARTLTNEIRPLAGELAAVAIAADEQYLHAFYACAGADGPRLPYRIVRIPWSLVASGDFSAPALQRCAEPRP